MRGRGRGRKFVCAVSFPWVSTRTTCRHYYFSFGKGQAGAGGVAVGRQRTVRGRGGR